MKRQSGKHIVEDQTGEIVGAVRSERFTKSMVEVWRHVDKANLFTPSEEKTLFRLSHFLQLNTNALVTPSGEYMTIERMADETGIDRSNIRKYVKELMRKNAIGRWSSNEQDIYYVNPFLFKSGDIKPYLFNLFDQEYHKRSMVEHIEAFKAGRKKTSLIAAQ